MARKCVYCGGELSEDEESDEDQAGCMAPGWGRHTVCGEAHEWGPYTLPEIETPMEPTNRLCKDCAHACRTSYVNDIRCNLCNGMQLNGNGEACADFSARPSN